MKNSDRLLAVTIWQTRLGSSEVFVVFLIALWQAASDPITEPRTRAPSTICTFVLLKICFAFSML